MAIWIRKSTCHSLKVLGYLTKKRKFGDSTKYCTALNKLAYLDGRL